MVTWRFLRQRLAIILAAAFIVWMAPDYRWWIAAVGFVAWVLLMTWLLRDQMVGRRKL